MRVIITGGTGLIGWALAASLTADGHEVIVLSRNPQGATGLPAGVRIVRWDAASRQGWEDWAEGAGAIVNLAGENLAEGRWTGARKAEISGSRVRAGQAVTQAIRNARQKPGVLIQASAVGYYGPHRAEVVDEQTPPGNDFQARVCLDWETSTASIEQLGVRRAVIRSGVVLSRKGGALPRLLRPFFFYAGGPLGSGRQWFPWIHIADEVGAIRFLIDRPDARGAFNLSAPNPVTYAELAQLIGRTLHRPALLPAPGFALRLVLGEMATAVLDGQREQPSALLRLGYNFRYPTLAPALEDLLS